MSDLEIRVASSAERPVIANLMQFYVHDFSEFWRDREDGELEADGRFGDYPLEPYWRDPGLIPLLIRRGPHPIGFALLNKASHSGDPVDRNVAEFFIVRKHRRGGAGTEVARSILSRYPGRWEAAVARRNVGALAFWRGAVSGHPQVSDVTERDVTTSEWNGFILRFHIAAAG